MKRLSLLVLLTFFFMSGYASAQCPCDTASLSNGLTGNEIVEIICPGGSVGENTEVFTGPQGIYSALADSPHTDYGVETFGAGNNFCTIDTDGIEPVSLELTDEQFLLCSASLSERCGLSTTRNIPTLSEWGLIAMTGVLVIAGAIALRRKKAAA